MALMSKCKVYLSTSSQFHEACWIFLVFSALAFEDIRKTSLFSLNYGQFYYKFKADESKKRMSLRCKFQSEIKIS